MDNLDRAESVEQMQRDIAINAQKNKYMHVQQTEECVDCGCLISSARQIATGGTDTCFECAQAAEKRAKQCR